MRVDNKIDIFSPKKNVWLGITITNAAANYIRQLLENDHAMLGLRISVKQSGCAGFKYVIKKATQSENRDLIYEYDGIRLYIPLKAMPFIDGTELDYVQEGLNQVFKFNNPQAKYACGCGESFNF